MAEIILPVTMTKLQKKLYKSILSKDAGLIKAILSRGNGHIKSTERAKLGNILMQLRKCLCHPFIYSDEIEEKVDDQAISQKNLTEASSKLELLNLMLPKLEERGHRVLIFSQFLGMLDVAEDFLDGLGMKHTRLDGTVSSMDKQKRIDAYNAEGSDIFAFLLSTRAGGVGINLASAGTVIILDPDFNPHQDLQALSRAHRIGQKKKVLVFHLMTRDTAEEKIMQLGKKKLSLDHLIIDRMGAEEDEEVDVESILKFGAGALFDDDVEEKVIKYDAASIDTLLDRSQMEQTTATDGKENSTDLAFSFARVWESDKGVLVDNGFGDGDHEISESTWDKILQEREEEARREREERARKEQLGRGKRIRQNLQSYAAEFEGGGDSGDDTDFQASTGNHHSDSDSDQHDGEFEVASDAVDLSWGNKANVGSTKAQRGKQRDPFSRRPSVPPIDNHETARLQTYPPRESGMPSQVLGPTSSHHFDAPSQIQPAAFLSSHQPVAFPSPHQPSSLRQQPSPSFPRSPQQLAIRHSPHPQPNLPRIAPATQSAPGQTIHTPKPIKCIACTKPHAPGCCPYKLAGVEHCPLCGIAHFGKGPICPHIGSETQVRVMMEALRASTEEPALVAEAVRYLRGRVGELRRRKRVALQEAERRGMEQEMAAAAAKGIGGLGGGSTSTGDVMVID